MTPDEFVTLVKSIKYKRGYTFYADMDWMRGGTIMKWGMYASVPDAGDPDHYISVHQGEWVAVEDLRHMDARLIVLRVREFIMAFEAHEMGEWLSIGGARPFDPHKPATVPGEEYGRD